MDRPYTYANILSSKSVFIVDLKIDENLVNKH